MGDFNNQGKIKINKEFGNSNVVDLKAIGRSVVKNPATKEDSLGTTFFPRTKKRNFVSINEFFTKAIQAIIYLAVFLMPIFILPFNSEYWEIPKQYLLAELSVLGLVLWIVKSIFIDKEINIRFASIDIIVLFFIAISALSAFWGVDAIMSFLGYYGDVNGSLMGILSLGIFYFLIVNSGIESYGLIKIFIVSTLIASFASLLWLSGIFTRILSQAVINEFPVLSLRSINTMGFSSSVLIWHLAAVAAFMVGMVFTKQTDINRENIAKYIQDKIKDKKRTIVFFLPFVVIFIIILSLPQFKNSISQNAILSKKTSWDIFQNEINSRSIKNIIIGSGPATFFYDFSMYKPKEFNQTVNWNLRYSKSGSAMLEKIITIGIVGTISYVLLLVAFFGTIFYSRKNYPEFANAIILFSVVEILSQLLNPQSFFSTFSFWLILSAGSSFFVGRPIRAFKIPNLSPAYRSVLSGSGAAIIIILAFGSYQIGKFYIADIVYADSIKKAAGGNIDHIKHGLDFAASLNPYRFEYHTVLAKLYLKEIDQNINDSQLNKDAEKSAKMANLADKAIKEAKMATEIAPNNVIAYETLGVVYSNLNLLIDGASEWAEKSFSRALELEPTNPVLLTELGKVRISIAAKDKTKEDKTEAAILDFQKALKLKPNYYEAGSRLSLALEKKGDIDQAIKNLEELEKAGGDNLLVYNSEIVFQLGRLYYNIGRNEESIALFRKIAELYPDYSNARYSLGLALEKKGLVSEAIKEFEKVLELNPGNEEIKRKLNNLKPEKNKPLVDPSDSVLSDPDQRNENK